MLRPDYSGASRAPVPSDIFLLHDACINAFSTSRPGHGTVDLPLRRDIVSTWRTNHGYTILALTEPVGADAGGGNAGMRCRLTQQVSNGRVGRWSMAGLPTPSVWHVVARFASQPISPDLS